MTSDDIVSACDANFAEHSKDCSGFVRAVTAALGYTLEGDADAIMDYIKENWVQSGSGAEAASFAGEGTLVIAGLRSDEHTPARNHGHVAIVVPGDLYRDKYPLVWCGSLGSAQSQGDKSVGEVWNKTDRDHVTYWMAPTQ
jgi:cell wall-associated NlpC family hydrolase